MLEGADAIRRPERFEQMVTSCEADFRGRAGYEERHYPQGQRLRRLLAAVRAVDAGVIASGEDDPAKIPQRIREARIAAIRAAD
jgi:tRNA nucleotidyltransferase (CCA-adding enzyme)